MLEITISLADFFKKLIPFVWRIIPGIIVFQICQCAYIFVIELISEFP